MTTNVDMAEVRPADGPEDPTGGQSAGSRQSAPARGLKDAMMNRSAPKRAVKQKRGKNALQSAVSTASPREDYKQGVTMAVQSSANTCDLRGMRVDEALTELDMIISQQAAASSTGTIFVVHGVGTGKVKAAVLEALKSNSQVVRFEPNEGMGGDGCTVAYLF
ncbi:hypothetical protein CYMTET_14725 [Cymbomonas tetramitiformis]|uniref:Smr domain-containing protein n=2 Tax=Cymbomonas tetramitiformis TaxID=36881 RepID=A0AAE0GFU0_9CHLO|nr:hypothetical protein CYMTET_14725 [Cymbomonas tetramitiformis]